MPAPTPWQTGPGPQVLKGFKVDLAEAFRVILRRWRVAVPVLVLTLIAIAVVEVWWPTKYQSTAELSLIESRNLADQPGNGNNPYVATSDLSTLAGILIANLSSDQDARQLAALGMTNGFTAEVPNFTTNPFVALTVTGPNSRTVRNSMPIVIGFAQQRLQQLQESGNARIPKAALIQAIVISPAGTPQAILKRKIELLAGVAVAGLVVLLLLSFGAEGRSLRRTESPEIPDGQREIGTLHPNVETGEQILHPNGERSEQENLPAIEYRIDEKETRTP